MKCVDCPNYLPDRDEPGCRNDGDVINAWQDIYCGEVDGEEKEWAVRRKIQVAASGGANVDEPKMAVNTELRKDTNPKDNAGSHKWRQYATLPITVLWEVGVAMLEGSLKYGRHNYRAFGARASVYYDAAKGHIDQWWEGEDIDPDSGIHHLSKAIASLVVLRDSQMFGRCVDDRPPSSDVSKVRANLQAVVDVLFGRYPETAKAWSKGDDLPPWFDAKECKLGNGVIGENGQIAVYGQPGNGKTTLHAAVFCRPVSREDAVNLCNMALNDIKIKLHGVYLRGMDLHGVDLHGLDLHGMDLRGTDFSDADLHGTNLRGADLRGANLFNAKAYGANFGMADLRWADLRNADLHEADFEKTVLEGVLLSGANLDGTNLCLEDCG